MDVNHGMLFSRPVRIWVGDYTDCARADIVVLAAGVAHMLELPLAAGEKIALAKSSQIVQDAISLLIEYMPSSL